MFKMHSIVEPYAAALATYLGRVIWILHWEGHSMFALTDIAKELSPIIGAPVYPPETVELENLEIPELTKGVAPFHTVALTFVIANLVGLTKPSDFESLVPEWLAGALKASPLQPNVIKGQILGKSRTSLPNGDSLGVALAKGYSDMVFVKMAPNKPPARES